MKIRLSPALILLAILLVPTLAMAAMAAPASGSQPVPAAGSLFADLASPSCANAVSPALTPEPLFRTDPAVCNGCGTPVLCLGQAVGTACGTSTATHCQVVPSCAAGQVSCRCQ